MTGVLIQGGFMGLFLLLGWLWPRVKVPPVNRDNVSNVLNGAMLAILRFTLVAWIAAQSEIGLLDLSWLSMGWAQLLLAFLVLDFSRYWLHYAAHRVPLLWTFHRVHHSAERLDATTGLRMHVVDFFQLSAVPLLLFGVLLDTSSFELWVVPTALYIGVFFDTFQHANIPMDMTRPWNRAWNMLLNNPHFHSWHHTRDGALCDGNYSNTLIIWDRIFGTEVTRPTIPEAFGLEADQALRNDPLSWQLLRSR